LKSDFSPPTLGALFARHRARILLTYALFNVENLLAVLQPLVLGWAINGLLAGRWDGVGWFAAQHLAHVALGAGRRAYDTRAFTAIYNGLVAPLIGAARRAGVDASTVAARAALSRELVDFYETHLPLLIASLYSSLGALAMLLWFDPWIATACTALLIPAALVQARAWPRLERLSGRIHDRLEREVHVIADGSERGVERHFGLLRRCRIALSDVEMRNFVAVEVFVLALIVLSLARFCSVPGATPGAIFSQLMYVVTFVAALDQGPLLVQQVVRIRDIQRRLAGPPLAPQAAPAAGAP